MIVAAGGVALNLDVCGSGEPVVCLHGHALDLRMWDDLVPALTGAGFRVVRYDLRGHGRSSSPPEGYRWGDHAADLEAVLDHLGEPDAHLVGFSKGAGVALELAARKLARVRSLALVSPWLPDHPLSDELRSSLRRIAVMVRELGVAEAMSRGWLHHPLLASAMALPGLRERVEGMALGFPGGEYVAGRDLPDREWRMVDRLRNVTARSLVLSGERDLPDLRTMATALVGGLPDVRHETIAGAGHFVVLERPARSAELLLEFLAASRAAAVPQRASGGLSGAGS